VTSIWERFEVERKVLNVLATVQPAPSPDLGGHPFLSTYQLAILLDTRYPEVRQALGNVPIGGADSGARTSLAQYLAERLAAQLRTNGEMYPIEGAALSRTHLGEMWFKVPGERDFRNSNAEAGYDLSLFRLREL
jgi:hypothetical protein